VGQSASDVISVVVSQQTVSLLLPGFGIPLLLTGRALIGGKLVRYYGGNAAGLAQMVTDGYLTSDPAYLQAAALVAQSPAPSQFAVGHLTTPPTQVFTIIPPGAASGAGVVYSVILDGVVYSYTSVGADSVNTIATGLYTVIHTAAPSGLTITNPTGQVVITASTAGAFHSIQLLDANGNPSSVARANLNLTQTHAEPSPSLATQMTAILQADNGWYAVSNPWDSYACALALAAWVETNKKLYIVNSVDDLILQSGTSATTDIALKCKNNAYTRTAVLYKSNNGSFAQAAWLGRVLPLVAGSENWAYKTLAGVSPDTLSEGEISNACGVPTSGTQGKRASIYSSIFGVNITEFGQVGSGAWLDITRGVDALVVDMGARIFGDLSGPNKIPYTDKGVTVIEKDVRASLAFFTAAPQNFLAESPAPTVSVPAVASLTSSQRNSRVLPNVNWTANLAGALNGVEIQGNVIA
jgi:hypothetical protein